MVIENVFSSVSYAISGMPQDSVLWAGIVLCFYKRCSCYLSWTFSYIKLLADDLLTYTILLILVIQRQRSSCHWISLLTGRLSASE